MTPAILTKGLTKDYGSGRGLFELDLEVEPGEVFGYLGPNGAGKTTTIRLLMGMISPTAGRGEIFGLDTHRDAVAVKRLVGYVPGELPQFGGMRGKEIVAYIAGLRGGVESVRVAALASRLELDLGQKFREYSRGNKQKLAILLGLVHEPRLLILDEPTGGLDPLNQQEFYRMVREARDHGATVFLSSHILSEVERTCDHVGIIRHGRLVRVANLADLREMHVHQVDIEFASAPPEGTIDAILGVPGIEQVTAENHRVTCVARGEIGPLLRAVANAEVTNLVSREPSLEDVFLAYYRDDGAPAANPSQVVV
jgi:ABC-2 type transport system ATP-binding protein